MQSSDLPLVDSFITLTCVIMCAWQERGVYVCKRRLYKCLCAHCMLASSTECCST